MQLIDVILGGYFLISGILMVVFHKRLRKFFEDVFASVPEIERLLPRDRSFTKMIILSGVMSALAGLTLLVMYFVNNHDLSGKS